MILITGLDGYRTELSVWIQGWHNVGCAVLVVEIPGTGDNPATPGDPSATDRVWTSMFEWIGQQPEIDQDRIGCWAFSTGGYFATRLAHTHPDKLQGVIAQGGGCHHMFDAEWLQASLTGEYPFDLGSTLGYAFGYGSDFEKFKKEAAGKFSLVNDGTLDKPGCARLLMVNGPNDSIFPVDDLYVALEHGDPKEARVVPGTSHMGEPDAFFINLKWMAKRLRLTNMNPGAFMATIPSRPKY